MSQQTSKKLTSSSESTQAVGESYPSTSPLCTSRSQQPNRTANLVNLVSGRNCRISQLKLQWFGFGITSTTYRSRQTCGPKEVHVWKKLFSTGGRTPSTVRGIEKPDRTTTMQAPFRISRGIPNGT